MTGQGHLANIGKVSYAARFTLFDGPASEILSLEPQQIERVESDWWIARRISDCSPLLDRLS